MKRYWERIIRGILFNNDFTGATGRDAVASLPVAHWNVLKRIQRETFSKVSLWPPEALLKGGFSSGLAQIAFYFVHHGPVEAGDGNDFPAVFFFAEVQADRLGDEIDFHRGIAGKNDGGS